MKLVLDNVRKTVHEIDRLTWEENRVTGERKSYLECLNKRSNGRL